VTLCWKLFSCMTILVIICRSDDYFLCIYSNCMIYRLIRNRALQVGIRAMSVFSGPKPGELPVVFEWYVELPSTLVVLFVCCSHLLLGFVD